MFSQRRVNRNQQNKNQDNAEDLVPDVVEKTYNVL